MIDTSLLIEYYRKAKKGETRLYQHAVAGKKLVVSAISEYEILNGAKPQHIEFWGMMRGFIDVLPFDSGAAQRSAEIVSQLKKNRRSIDAPDLFIAATAIEHGLPFDTLNTKDFEHIEALVLL